MSERKKHSGKSRALSPHEVFVRRTCCKPATVASPGNSHVFRFPAIVLALVLLVACGGSRGGIGTELQPLPTGIDVESARMAVGGSLPPDMATTEIETVLQSRAMKADTLLFSDIIYVSETRVNGDVSCMDVTCTGSVDNDVIRFSLDDFDGNLGVNSEILDADNRNLAGYNKEYRLVMTDRGVTLGQGRSAGRIDDARFQFQSYGGWLDNNVFAVQYETATDGTDTLTWHTSYSFGKESGSNPTGSVAVMIWEGVMAGMNTETGHFVHGDAGIVYVLNPNVLDIVLNNIKNLNDGSSVSPLNFRATPTEGNFESAADDIKGSFYGTNHEEVGGVFNKDNIIGAFGATRAIR